MRQIFSPESLTTTEFGDVYYVSPDPQPVKLLFNPTGWDLLHKSNLSDLLNLPFKPPVTQSIYGGKRFGFVTQETLKTDSQTLTVAFKRFFSDYLPNGIGGFEQFYALRTLEMVDFRCISPLVAGPNKMISEWAIGNKLNSSTINCRLKDKEFLTLLKKTTAKFKKDKIWPQNWEIDTYVDNYLENPSFTKLSHKYILIDPVYVPPYLCGY